MGANITLVSATEQHFDAILELERGAGRSLVTLTDGHALREAHDRGHEIVVALDGEELAGWIWYGRSLERGAEEIGQIYRVAVAAGARRAGVGRLLVARALSDLSSRGCTRARTTVEGEDVSAQALFEDAAFFVDAMIMERKL